LAILEKLGFNFSHKLYRGLQSVPPEFVHYHGSWAELDFNPNGWGCMIDEFDLLPEAQYCWFGKVDKAVNPGEVGFPSLEFAGDVWLARSFARRTPEGIEIVETTVGRVLWDGYRIAPDVELGFPTNYVGGPPGVLILPGPYHSIHRVPRLRVNVVTLQV
jgi:hypothetical protein